MMVCHLGRKNSGTKHWLSLALMLILCPLMLLAGCGGGGGGGSSGGGGGGGTSDLATGFFFDSPVQGLHYTSGAVNGVTDQNGTFTYVNGSTIRFMIGGIQIGALCTPQGVMTPIDLISGASSPDHQAVMNILCFLQTVDDNQTPSDGIQISTRVHNLASGLSLDFTLDPTSFAAAAQAIVNQLFPGERRTLVAREDALAHFNTSLSGMVTTTRDDKGVWFIRETDRVGEGHAPLYAVFMEMGYNVALDRLWQAEKYRRSARGKLAEVFGPSQLAADVFARIVGYSDDELQQAFAGLGKDEQQIISGYAAGFNKRIAEVTADPTQMPFEFASLNLTPEPWTYKDILAWLALLQQQFDPSGYETGQLDNARLYTDLTTAYGLDTGAGMFSDLRWLNDPSALTYYSTGADAGYEDAAADRISGLPIGPDLSEAAEFLRNIQEQIDNNLKEINAFVKGGSYAWTVGGSKTASGNPIIYSGPQMGFSTPSIVQEGSIDAGGLRISGMTVSGIPGIIIGRTPHHAWSMQVGQANTSDLYIESASTVTLHRTETIKVAGADDVTVGVYRSSHGPIIYPMPYDPATYVPNAGNPIVSWKYAHRGYELKSLAGFLKLAKATSMDEFGEGIEQMAVSQHFCYADRDGNIAYWMSGRDPLRPAGEWRMPQGFFAAPLEWDASSLIARSHSRNDSKGYYGGWNNKTNPGYNNSFQSTWQVYGTFHRARVVDDYLAAGSSLTFENIRDLAIDIAATDSLGAGGNPWPYVEGYFTAALGPAPTADQQAVLDLLAAWDGHFVAGGAANWVSGPDRSDAWVIMNAWIAKAIEYTFKDELDPAGQWISSDDPLLLNVMLHGLAGAGSPVVNNYDWFQNTADPGAPQTADGIIVKALNDALADLGGLAARPWGAAQRGTIDFVHEMYGIVHSMPFASRSTYAHCVEYGPNGPVRIESMFPLGQSGDIRLGNTMQPVPNANFFTMSPVYDAFAPRVFPLFN